jgi:hypothetical protein
MRSLDTRIGFSVARRAARSQIIFRWGAGSLQVGNSCRYADGFTKSHHRSGRVVPASGNARLKVRLFDAFSGDYWIIGLDEKTLLVGVGDQPSRRFLWILSRKPAGSRNSTRRSSELRWPMDTTPNASSRAPPPSVPGHAIY